MNKIQILAEKKYLITANFFLFQQINLKWQNNYIRLKNNPIIIIIKKNIKMNLKSNQYRKSNYDILSLQSIQSRTIDTSVPSLQVILNIFNQFIVRLNKPSLVIVIIVILIFLIIIYDYV